MRILLANLYSAQNRGDYLITLGTIELLRHTFEGVEISGMMTSRERSLAYLGPDIQPYVKVLSRVVGNPSEIVPSPAESANQSTLGLTSAVVARMARAEIVLLGARIGGGNGSDGKNPSLARLREFDLVLFVGGSYLDASTLKDYPLLFSHLYPARLAHLAGVRYAYVGVSISGVDQLWARRSLGTAFSRASLVVFREAISFAQAESTRLIGNEPLPRTAVLPDLALGLAGSLRGFRKPRSRRSPVTVGVAFRTWEISRVNPLVGDPVKTVARSLARAAQHVPMRFVLIPFSGVSSSETDNDLRSCRELERVLRRIDGTLEVSLTNLPPPEDVPGLARVFDGLDFAVCVRLHATIFAAMLGVPSVTIEYRGHKTQGVCESLGLRNYYVRSLTEDDLERKVVEMARDYDQVSARVIAAVDQQSRMLEDNLVPLLKATAA